MLTGGLRKLLRGSRQHGRCFLLRYDWEETSRRRGGTRGRAGERRLAEGVSLVEVDVAPLSIGKCSRTR